MARVEKVGRCLFCGAKAIVINEQAEPDPARPLTGERPWKWSAGHEAPKCKAFERAIQRKKPAIVLEN